MFALTVVPPRASSAPLLVNPDSARPDLTRAFEFAFEPDEVEHTLIGPYRLIEKIGEGAFGVVWLAEQQEPVRRRVGTRFDLTSGRFTTHRLKVSEVSIGSKFSPAGQSYSGATDGTIHFWRAPSWAEIAAAEKRAGDSAK